jgi:hypothetical protein
MRFYSFVMLFQLHPKVIVCTMHIAMLLHGPYCSIIVMRYNNDVIPNVSMSSHYVVEECNLKATGRLFYTNVYKYKFVEMKVSSQIPSPKSSIILTKRPTWVRISLSLYTSIYTHKVTSSILKYVDRLSKVLIGVLPLSLNK